MCLLAVWVPPRAGGWQRSLGGVRDREAGQKWHRLLVEGSARKEGEQAGSQPHLGLVKCALLSPFRR